MKTPLNKNLVFNLGQDTPHTAHFLMEEICSHLNALNSTQTKIIKFICHMYDLNFKETEHDFYIFSNTLRQGNRDDIFPNRVQDYPKEQKAAQN
jgi:hypothetical protein